MNVDYLAERFDEMLLTIISEQPKIYPEVSDHAVFDLAYSDFSKENKAKVILLWAVHNGGGESAARLRIQNGWQSKWERDKLGALSVMASNDIDPDIFTLKYLEDRTFGGRDDMEIAASWKAKESLYRALESEVFALAAI